MKIKVISTLIVMLAVLNCYSQTQMGALTVQTPDNAMDHENGASQKNTGTIYDYVVKDISGNDFKLADLKGKKVMIVNTASECGFTPQYKQLEELYEQYKEKGLVIIGFPANNFGAQEPGDNAKIATFCQKNYGVTFPMMSKISVQGKDMAPLYQFLTQMKLNKFSDNKVEWNFQKYLIDAKGRLVRVVPSKVVPTDESIINWIKS